MPLFSLRPAGGSGIEPLVTFLLGRRESSIPDARLRRLGVDGEAEEKEALIRRLNCRGCHGIGAEPRSVCHRPAPGLLLRGK